MLLLGMNILQPSFSFSWQYKFRIPIEDAQEVYEKLFEAGFCRFLLYGFCPIAEKGFGGQKMKRK